MRFRRYGRFAFQDTPRRRAAVLRQYPAAVRARLLDYWNRHRWLPGDPVYFLDMMHMHDTGQLNLDAPGVLTTAAFAE